MSNDGSDWNAELHDRGLTQCSNCGTVDSQAIGKAIADAVREELAKHAPDVTVARSPLAEGDGSGGEGCEAENGSEPLADWEKDLLASYNRVHASKPNAEQVAAMKERHRGEQTLGRSEELDVEALEKLAYKRGRLHLDAALDLIVEVRRLRADVKRSSQAWDQLLGERDSAVVRGDQWKADAIDADNQRTLVQKFLNETVRERDEARAALAVVKAQAESEAVARAEAEAELAALPEKIADAIADAWERRAKGSGSAHAARCQAWHDAEDVARSFIPTEPVPEPVREWGVRHTTGLTDRYDRENDARDVVNSARPYGCPPGCELVSRVPGGEWEAAE